ncbi:MAG: hypothetical protein KIT22_03955, partial [Verrucomicrobiae bacterium]|nr:hypothetical protein [Verrucomicrobiae bacterium]
MDANSREWQRGKQGKIWTRISRICAEMAHFFSVRIREIRVSSSASESKAAETVAPPKTEMRPDIPQSQESAFDGVS